MSTQSTLCEYSEYQLCKQRLRTSWMCPNFACTVAIASRDAIRSSAVSPIPNRIRFPLTAGHAPPDFPLRPGPHARFALTADSRSARFPTYGRFALRPISHLGAVRTPDSHLRRGPHRAAAPS